MDFFIKDNLKLRLYLFWLLIIVLLEEAIRYSFGNGDFVGYVIAGNLALDHANIYSNWLNTWPPVFSVFSIILAKIDQISPIFNRILWQFLSFLALYRSIDLVGKSLNLPKFNLPFNIKSQALNPAYFIPILLIFKYILDNFVNIQINVIMLWLLLESIFNFTKKNYFLASLLIAITLSFKVYSIFFFAWFIFKREWKMVFYTLLFTALINSIAFIYFGFEQASNYYIYWWKNIAQAFPMLMHKNQSFFALVWRLTVPEDNGLGFNYALTNLSMDQGKKIAYLLILGASVYPMIKLFPRNENNSEWTIQELFLFIGLIPILSPLAWKAYFIFLLPIIFSNYFYLFVMNKNAVNLKIVFWTSIIMLIFSSEIFVGRTVSKYLEAFSFICLGAILQIITGFYLRVKN